MCKEGYKPCLVGVHANGCPLAGLGNICIEKFSSADQVCEESCPLPSCTSPPSKVCSGGIDDTTGCSLDRFCADIIFGNDGEACPPTCPINCQDDEKTCPGGTSPEGCPLPDQCIPKLLATGCENTCPHPSCPPPSKACPGGFDETTECPIDPYCPEPEFGTDGEPCPPTCPASCPPGMQTCPGEIDSNGCKVTENTYTCISGMHCLRF